MSRRAARPKTAEPGGDEFLDVVANLVGILIILVMVIGAGARSAAMALAKKEIAPEASAAPTEPAPEIAEWNAELATAQSTNRSLQAAAHDVEQRIEEEKRALALREQERGQVQLLVNVAEERLNEHRTDLSSAEQEQYDLQAKLVSVQRELQQLDQAKRVAGEQPPPKVLEHFPTPMAKTVFGTELHFRLHNGLIAFVPWDELVERLKADAPNRVHRLRDTDRVEETLPPMGGFVLKYALKKTSGVVRTGGGMATQTKIELDRFVLIPVREPMGEPVREALANPQSDLLGRLNALGPRRATLTVWVYPESFEDFRILKSEMFKRGFLTAARPLPTGMPIGGSPDGSRSTAE